MRPGDSFEDSNTKSNTSSEIQLISPGESRPRYLAGSIVCLEPETRPSPSLNMIDEECFSKAKLDLSEALKHRFPRMDTNDIIQVTQKASDIFRTSRAAPDYSDPPTMDDNHNPASEATSKMNTARYSRGTPNYRAPEVIAEDAGYNKIDIWALGCIVFELSTGVKLFRDDFSRHSETIASTTAIRPLSKTNSG
jgi:serine/threonine protein kinase